MSPLVTIDDNNIEKKLTMVRRYHNEILFVVMFTCIYVLFNMVISLNNKLNDYATTKGEQQTKTIVENTEVLRDIGFLIRDIKVIIMQYKPK